MKLATLVKILEEFGRVYLSKSFFYVLFILKREIRR